MRHLLRDERFRVGARAGKAILQQHGREALVAAEVDVAVVPALTHLGDEGLLLVVHQRDPALQTQRAPAQPRCG